MVAAASPSMYGGTLQPWLCRRSSTTGTPRPSITRPNATDHFTKCITSNPHFKEFQQQLTTKLGEASAAVTMASSLLLDAFVDSTFTFSHQSLRPTESNFAPVDEIGGRTEIWRIEGTISDDFPEGVYIRNGSNPLFGALHKVNSIFGQSEDIWVEGEGMLHALYFTKSREGNTWSVSYNNRYVQSDTFNTERDRQRPCFLSAIKGDPLAIIAASILNMLRFGKVFRNMSNTGVFEHAERVFSVAENDIPYEIDLDNLGTLCSWVVDGQWNMPFTAHPKVAPGSGELVIYGFNIVKPFLTIGVVSEDGKKLERKVDLKLERCTYCHEIGVTKMYNIIMDMPLTVDLTRILRGAPLIDFETESYARIGVMPRHGDADSVIWFDVEPFCTLHLINCFEEDHEVVIRGFRVPGSIITGITLEHTANEEPANQGPSEKSFPRLYEWRLNMKSRAVTGKYLTGTDVALEFPVINNKYAGLHHKYAYAQVIDVQGSLEGGCGTVRPKFGGFAKLHLQDNNKFCSGATFVPKVNGANEDDGWIISFVHDEEINTSQAHVIDAQRFENGPIAKITLPQRVPYGFHGTFIPRTTYKKT
ncbi:carotenoid 9,10(9',10')-cleavage dioxygenase 1 isoform X2 [Oryza sativa Japonica Group]|uniref:carotenoid 9,10(9',10')-cleavage dioxygenase 1 isoform X2 n=1 Tax=Oryza sativa subsp. japonica TaxID=39947 RepID=UPI00339CD115